MREVPVGIIDDKVELCAIEAPRARLFLREHVAGSVAFDEGGQRSGILEGQDVGIRTQYSGLRMGGWGAREAEVRG